MSSFHQFGDSEVVEEGMIITLGGHTFRMPTCITPLAAFLTPSLLGYNLLSVERSLLEAVGKCSVTSSAPEAQQFLQLHIGTKAFFHEEVLEMCDIEVASGLLPGSALNIVDLVALNAVHASDLDVMERATFPMRAAMISALASPNCPVDIGSELSVVVKDATRAVNPPILVRDGVILGMFKTVGDRARFHSAAGGWALAVRPMAENFDLNKHLIRVIPTDHKGNLTLQDSYLDGVETLSPIRVVELFAETQNASFALFFVWCWGFELLMRLLTPDCSYLHTIQHNPLADLVNLARDSYFSYRTATSPSASNSSFDNINADKSDLLVLWSPATDIVLGHLAQLHGVKLMVPVPVDEATELLFSKYGRPASGSMDLPCPCVFWADQGGIVGGPEGDVVTSAEHSSCDNYSSCVGSDSDCVIVEPAVDVVDLTDLPSDVYVEESEVECSDAELLATALGKCPDSSEVTTANVGAVFVDPWGAGFADAVRVDTVGNVSKVDVLVAPYNPLLHAAK